MVNQAIGVEVFIFIAWILLTIYGSIQKAKKKKAAEQQGQPYEEPETPEDDDPFKRVMEELLGKTENKKTEWREKSERKITEGDSNSQQRTFHWEEKTKAEKEEKKPVYESLPRNYSGTTGSLQSTAEAAKQLQKPAEFLASTEGNYIDTTYQGIVDKEGLPQTFNYEESHLEKAFTKNRIPGRGVIINGKRMLMRDALVAQIILERRS